MSRRWFWPIIWPICIAINIVAMFLDPSPFNIGVGIASGGFAIIGQEVWTC